MMSDDQRGKKIQNMQTGRSLTCLLLGSGSFKPWDKIGIIKGSTLSPSFLTSSPNERPATWNSKEWTYSYIWNSKFYNNNNNYELLITKQQTCRLSEDDDARELIKVFIRTGIISLRVFGVFATIVFHTCNADWREHIDWTHIWVYFYDLKINQI